MNKKLTALLAAVGGFALALALGQGTATQKQLSEAEVERAIERQVLDWEDQDMAKHRLMPVVSAAGDKWLVIGAHGGGYIVDPTGKVKVVLHKFNLFNDEYVDGQMNFRTETIMAEDKCAHYREQSAKQGNKPK